MRLQWVSTRFISVQNVSYYYILWNRNAHFFFFFFFFFFFCLTRFLENNTENVCFSGNDVFFLKITLRLKNVPMKDLAGLFALVSIFAPHPLHPPPHPHTHIPSHNIHFNLNPCPAESRYTLPLQTVQVQISWLLNSICEFVSTIWIK